MAGGLTRLTYRTALPVVLLVGLAGCRGCGEQDQPPAPAAIERAPVEVPPPFAPGPVASEAAFELIAAEPGALFLLGPPVGGLVAQPLGPYGAPAAEPIHITPDSAARVVEVAAASSAGPLAVAWIEDHDGDRVVRSTQGSALSALAPVSDLGPTGNVEPPVRGQIALGTSRSSFVAMHRGMPGPCVDGGPIDCIEFPGHWLQDPDGRGRVRRALPDPCPRPLAGIEWVDGVQYYGLCVAPDGERQTTLYALQFDPQYAHAQPLLAGCSPRGLVRANGGVWLSADCTDGSVGVVHVTETGTQRVEARPARLEVRCEDAALVIAADPLEPLRVTGPQSGLEAALPPALCPHGARAVWTGAALLVAVYEQGQVSLRRYQCRGTDLEPTDRT